MSMLTLWSSCLQATGVSLLVHGKAATKPGCIDQVLVAAPVEEAHQLEASFAMCASKAGYNVPLCKTSGIQEHVLYHSALLHGHYMTVEREDASTALDLLIFPQVPDFTIVMSVHNQADILRKNLVAILTFTTGLWELVLVFDDCTDSSLSMAESAIRDHVNLLLAIPQKQKSTNCAAIESMLHTNGTIRHNEELSVLTRIRLITQPTSVWETSSDNIGMRSSQPAKYFVLVQADMQVLEIGWNLDLTLPLEVYADIFAVSARCAHDADESNKMGRCVTDVGQRYTLEELLQLQGHVYLRHTANRGPIAYRAERLVALGFLDEWNFYLGDDDHDLCFRAWFQFAWRCAFYPIDFVAPIEEGTRRKQNFVRHSEPNRKDPSALHLTARQSYANQTNFIDMKRVIQTTGPPLQERGLSNEEKSRVLKMWRDKVSFMLAMEMRNNGKSGE
jgi:glycosyltransferase involved in cell wall biosynthesis